MGAGGPDFGDGPLRVEPCWRLRPWRRAVWLAARRIGTFAGDVSDQAYDLGSDFVEEVLMGSWIRDAARGAHGG